MRDKLGRFIKGFHPKTEFKKGQSSVFKNKKRPNISGKNHWNWKGGHRKDTKGYVLIRKPEHPFCDIHGYVREHRLVIEQQIGRYLLPEEQGHHLGKIDDNRPCTLMLFSSNSAHKRFHHNPGNVKPEEIIFDGRKL